MVRNRMYPERVGNISAFRGCGFGCTYCNFKNALRRSPCEKCRNFEPHAHLEVLNKTPPKTKPGEFLTIGLTGDISFATDKEMFIIIKYCEKWKDRTFLIQSKNPSRLMDWIFPDNVIIGTTIETDIVQNGVSNAPCIRNRFDAMIRVKDCRKAVTIEPIMDFDLKNIVEWLQAIAPEFCYVGYNSKNDVQIPEPSLEKTQLLIEKLREFTEVRPKLLRKARWEK